MNLAIAIPTYNEAANIVKLLPRIKKSLHGYPNLRCTVFIIDDNSPDGTGDKADSLGATLKDKNYSIKVIRRKKKEGLGKAYIYAFHKILAQNFDYVLQMDADLSHSPIYIPKFLDATKVADFVVGSRYMKGGGTANWSWHRRFLSRGGNIYTRLMLDRRITDYTGGFNLYSATILKSLALDKIYSKGYGFLIDLKYHALEKSNNIAEVPIMFTDREHGKSKMPKNIIVSNLLLVARIRLKRQA